MKNKNKNKITVTQSFGSLSSKVPSQTKRKYWRVILKNGVAVRHEGFIILEPCKVAKYANALGCKLMCHLPMHLRPQVVVEELKAEEVAQVELDAQ